MPAKKSQPANTKAKATAPKRPESKAEMSAKAAAKATAPKKAAAPVKKTVARPVTRAVRPAAPARKPVVTKEKEKREKVESRPLPTAPAGHAPLISADGSSSGSIELPKLLATSTKKMATLFQAFLAARSNARQATSATKNRHRVAGGGAKPWRQKGTGRARAGSTRSPLWRHGGVVFGPNGRQYWQRIPAKMRQAAFAEAVSARSADGRLLVVEDLKFEGERPRTREVVTWLEKIGDTGSTVFVWDGIDEPKARAMANIADLELRTSGSLRLFDLLTADTLLVQKAALGALAKRAGESDEEVVRREEEAVTA